MPSEKTLSNCSSAEALQGRFTAALVTALEKAAQSQVEGQDEQQTSTTPRDIVIGLSGGLDSVLLLTLAARYLAPTFSGRIQALHVHHGLSASADGWQAHCEQLCERLGIPLQVARVCVNTSEQGIEGGARDARYQAFAEHVPDHADLWLAHHADDQAETFFLRVFRGSGLTGLQSMAARRPLTAARSESRQVVRPWLAFERAQLAEVAGQIADLDYVDDESNADTRYERNWWRRQVLPLLNSRMPNVVTRLTTTTQRLRDDAELLHTLLAPIKAEAMDASPWPGTAPYRLSLAVLQAQPEQAHWHLIRHFFEVNGLAFPQGESVRHWLQQVLSAQGDRQPAMILKGASKGTLTGEQVGPLNIEPGAESIKAPSNWTLQRHQHFIYAWHEQTTAMADLHKSGAEDHVVQAWGAGMITTHNDVSASAFCSGRLIPADSVSDRVARLPGRQSQRFKSWFQVNGVPPWLRPHWPIWVAEEGAQWPLGHLQSSVKVGEPNDPMRLKWVPSAIGRTAPE